MKWQKFKKIDYLVDQKPDAKCCIVLFHGYGADATDLASLKQVYKLNQEVDWYFPQGILEVPIGPSMSGRAWFELRVSDFEEASGGAIPEIPIRPSDEKLVNEICQWLNHLGKLYDRVIFGGFSQGAIISSHCFYRLNFAPKAMLLLSGFLVAPSSFPTLPEPLKIPFFQSHGQRDMVLKMGGAQKLFSKLEDLGLVGTWKEFHGGHEIPMDVIADSEKFLNSTLDH